MRSFFDDFLKLGLTIGMKAPKVGRSLPIVLTKEEVKSLIDSTNNVRDRAIIQTLYCGLRVSEVVSALRTQNVEVPSGRVEGFDPVERCAVRRGTLRVLGVRLDVESLRHMASRVDDHGRDRPCIALAVRGSDGVLSLGPSVEGPGLAPGPDSREPDPRRDAGRHL